MLSLADKPSDLDAPFVPLAAGTAEGMVDDDDDGVGFESVSMKGAMVSVQQNLRNRNI
jgi:hypothetical protein